MTECLRCGKEGQDDESERVRMFKCEGCGFEWARNWRGVLSFVGEPNGKWTKVPQGAMPVFGEEPGE